MIYIFYSLSNPSWSVGTLHAIGLLEQSVHPSVWTSFVDASSLTSTLKCPTAFSLENPASSWDTRSSIIAFSSIGYTYSSLWIHRGACPCVIVRLIVQIQFDIAGEDLRFLAESVRDDREGIGDTILRILERKL